MTLPGARENLLRPRDAEDADRVTQIELFFDLVFVFAITQLSHTLLSKLSPMGAVETALLFAAVWWAWIYTSWVTNWLDPERQPVRLLLFALMLLGLVMSSALPQAFGSRGLAFAATYVAIQLGRSLFMLWALANHNRNNFLNFSRVTVWLAASAVFWLLGGWFAASRLFLWAVALAIELVSPSVGFRVPGLGRSNTRDWDIAPEHLAERCSAVVLIALGESITVTGAAFFELAWTPSVVAGFIGAFVAVVALWWIYFDTAADNTSRAFAASADPGRLGRIAYTYLHALLVAGIVVVAVADDLVLQHPEDRASIQAVLVTLGGPAIYLIGNAAFRRLLAPRIARSHLAGLILLAALAPFATRLTTLELGLATGLVLVAVAATGSLLHRRQARGHAAPAT